MAGWLRKAESKAIAQYSWGLGFSELGNSYPNVIYLYCLRNNSLLQGYSFFNPFNTWHELPSVKRDVDQVQTPLMPWVSYLLSSSSLDVNISLNNSLKGSTKLQHVIGESRIISQGSSRLG